MTIVFAEPVFVSCLFAEDAKDLHKKARAIKEDISERKEKVSAFRKKENDILKKAEALEYRLNQAQKTYTRLEKQLGLHKKEIADARALLLNISQRIEQNREYVSKRLVALYKLNCLGKWASLASADTASELLLRKKTIKQVIEKDFHVIEILETDKKRYEETLRTIEEKSRLLSAETKKQETQLNAIKKIKKQKQELLENIRKEKTGILASIRELQDSANKLDQKIKDLGKTGISGERTRSRGFAAMKGRLKMPVKGRVVSWFGEFIHKELNVKNFRSGIEIEAKTGTPVTSVYEGKVIYCDMFNNYGKMIIIDHGDHYYTLYAHAETVFKEKGQKVKTGEVIASVGNTDSPAAGNLHFEVRNHGKPMDPMKWLQKE